jgi:serine/threonine-protein kinase
MCPEFAKAETSGSQFRGETAEILSTRLRAVALLLGLTSALFIARGLYFNLLELVPGEVTLLAVCVATIVLLTYRKSLSLNQLRWLELGIFGSAAGFLVWAKYTGLKLAVLAGDPVAAMAVIQATTTYFFALLAFYGMFIPNTWRRAAAVVIPMGLMAPLAAFAFKLSVDGLPNYEILCEQVATPMTLSANMLTLLIGACTAIYGTHIIHHLRRDVQRAKQFGQYKLKRLLGAGGMGEVYLAEHMLLKRPCAVKLIHPDKAGDPRVLARFEKEVRATAKLSHPNTIEIFDYGHTDDGQFYYVMEYLPGMSLSELVRRHGPLPAGRVVHMIRQVASAIREAHRLKLLHRDIKPANIFVAQRGGMDDVAKLLDFGLVRPMHRDGDPQSPCDVETPSITGSPLYMSPEQGPTGRLPDARSDLYSLGAVAYYLITGAPPFQADGVMRLLAAHATEAVVPPSRRAKDVPADLERVVLKCLAKRPEDRFQDAGELIHALDACEAAGTWTEDMATEWWEQVGRHNEDSLADIVPGPEDHTLAAPCVT